jgi:hypothetical protein
MTATPSTDVVLLRPEMESVPLTVVLERDVARRLKKMVVVPEIGVPTRMKLVRPKVSS